MATDLNRSNRYLENLLQARPPEEILRRLHPRPGQPFSAVPMERGEEGLQKRLGLLGHVPEFAEHVADPATREQHETFARNIENFVGTVKVPVGLAGALRVNGSFAQGDYLVPLATTEAALVASYNRGCRLISAAGGCTAVLLAEGVCRAPGFGFSGLAEAAGFAKWVLENFAAFRDIAEKTTRYGKLMDIRLSVEGNHVYLIFDYSTGDAAGQNMATLATDAVFRHILENSPVPPRQAFLEANLSGDKKASSQSFLTVRGKKVTCEILLPRKLVADGLHTTPEDMVDYWRYSAMGGILSGTMGIQGHFANGLAAVYLACGQDVACVSESSVGVTRMEIGAGGGLYTSVTLPNLIVGTVGGGTGLPSQKACLRVLGLAGAGCARAFAEVCAALCLAGELSIIGALAAGDFARAHRHLARGKPGSGPPSGPGDRE